MRNLGVISLILSICAIVLSVAFLSTIQTVEQNQNNIISRVESLEQSGEEPGEDPGENLNAKMQFVILQPGDTLQLTSDMYCIDVELTRESDGGIYSDPTQGPSTNVRIDVYNSYYSEDDLNCYQFRYYIGRANYIYYFTANFSAEYSDFLQKTGQVFIQGYNLPFITLSENNVSPATVVIYYI